MKLHEWLLDKLFDEKINARICWTILAIAGLFILIQLIIRIEYILIS